MSPLFAETSNSSQTKTETYSKETSKNLDRKSNIKINPQNTALACTKDSTQQTTIIHKRFGTNSEGGNVTWSIFLYGFSACLLFFFAVYIFRKLQFFYQKILLILCTITLLSSAVYHTHYYGKSVWKVAEDQEGYYFPKLVHWGYASIENHELKYLVNQIVYVKPGNSVYPFIYWTIKRIFGPHYFFESFFFVCMLNSILFLFTSLLLFKIFEFFNPRKSLLFFYCLVFFQPFMILRNAIPLANSLTVFSLILFLYSLIFDKKLHRQLLCLFLCFLAHKILYFPSIIICSYLLWNRFASKTYTKVMILCIISIFGGYFLSTHSLVLKRYIFVANHFRLGKSFIPPTHIYKKSTNLYLCPLITNSNSFLYKTKEGNLYGWIYAIYVNLLVLFMLIKICFFAKNFRNLDPIMKRLCIISLLFILSFSIAGAYIYNYLNLNRHCTNTLIVWIVLALSLSNRGQQIRCNVTKMKGN